jgi:HlyD family secretion protein
LPAGAHQKEPVPTSSSPAIGKSEQFVAVVIPATIQAFFVTDLYAKGSGFVSQVNNDIGDHVKQGEVLAVIEDPELQAQHNKAQAAVQQTQADIEVAKRQLAAMQADLTLQQVTLKRQQQLFAGKASTAQTLDEARAKEGVSSANLEGGRARIKLAEANFEAAKAEAKRLHALLQYDKIVAPYDCVVTRRLVNPGDLVQAATSTQHVSTLYLPGNRHSAGVRRCAGGKRCRHPPGLACGSEALRRGSAHGPWDSHPNCDSA